METVTLIANLALTLSFVIALIFGVVQTKAAARDRRERLTLETLHNYQTRDFAELILHVISAPVPDNLEAWQQFPPEKKVLFLQFTQEMESLGIRVAERFISIDLVDKTLGAFVVTSWEKFKMLIMDMREKQPDPFLCEYYQWLAEHIDERMRNNPRKPVFETDGKVVPVK